jgi:hypothetical protein
LVSLGRSPAGFSPDEGLLSGDLVMRDLDTLTAADVLITRWVSRVGCCTFLRPRRLHRLQCPNNAQRLPRAKKPLRSLDGADSSRRPL